jgi:hypothetical protein
MRQVGGLPALAVALSDVEMTRSFAAMARSSCASGPVAATRPSGVPSTSSRAGGPRPRSTSSVPSSSRPALHRAWSCSAPALGATTWEGGPDGPAGDLHDMARLPLLLHPLHELALGIEVQRGHDPDRPRHLGQVVIIER